MVIALVQLSRSPSLSSSLSFPPFPVSSYSAGPSLHFHPEAAPPVFLTLAPESLYLHTEMTSHQRMPRGHGARYPAHPLMSQAN